MDSELSKIKIEPFSKETSLKIEAYLEKTGKILLVFLWLFCFYIYTTGPDFITVHFNFNTSAPKTVYKLQVFIYPFLATLLCSYLSYMNQYAFGYQEKTIIKGVKNILFYKLVKRSVKVFIVTMPLIGIFSSLFTLLHYQGLITSPGYFYLLINGFLILPFLYYFIQALRMLK